VILIEVPVGYVMRATYGPSFSNREVLALHELASQFHHTLGCLVLLAALADSAQFGPTRLWLLGFDDVVPRIWPALPFDDASGYRRFASIHRWALWAGLGLLALHVLSALWHHGVRRDAVLWRMWPLADR
jgi:cytochrome b561